MATRASAVTADELLRMPNDGARYELGGEVSRMAAGQRSYGFQAGVQTFGYALFLISDSTFTQLNSNGGWELGVGPSIVVLAAGRVCAPDHHGP